MNARAINLFNHEEEEEMVDEVAEGEVEGVAEVAGEKKTKKKAGRKRRWWQRRRRRVLMIKWRWLKVVRRWLKVGVRV